MNTNSSIAYQDLVNLPASGARQAFRDARYSGHTAGLGTGLLQCNLVILPSAAANAFYGFCKANPQTSPYIASSEPGHTGIPQLGEDIDLRTDLPSYCVYRHGKLAETVTDITALWNSDWVAFAVGCSFTFERALQADGISLRHIEQGTTVPMYRTSLQTKASPPFGGNVVMTMRPIPAADVERARSISARYPHAHGAPMHAGDPKEIGITDLSKPEWGKPVVVRPGEIPMFWGCGVTTQVAIEHARLDCCITHAPGAMLLTDIDETAPPADNFKQI